MLPHKGKQKQCMDLHTWQSKGNFIHIYMGQDLILNNVSSLSAHHAAQMLHTYFRFIAFIQKNL